MEIEKSKLNILFSIYLIFNILFPKAGIKLGGIPLTIGNLVYIILLLISVPLFAKKNIRLDLTDLIIIISSFYWLWRLSFFHDGTDFGKLVSYITCLCFYPLIYYVVMLYVDNKIMLTKTINVIKVSLYILMIYSVLQYIFGIGKTDIPGLTVNYTDYIENPNRWWYEKHNIYSRDDGSSKVFSTYQNGNLFGANLLIFFPMVFSIEKQNKKYLLMILFLSSILLSGSRTMCLTVIIFGVYLLIKKFQKNRYKTVEIFGLIAAMILVIIIASRENVKVIERFKTVFDWNVLKNGTGRIPKTEEFFSWLYLKGNVLNFLFGSLGCNYEGGTGEVTYIYIFILGGIVGLLLTFFPILYIYSNLFKNKNDSVIKGICYGLTLYLIAAVAEGAFFLPPTVLNLWFILGLANAYNNIVAKEGFV